MSAYNPGYVQRIGNAVGKATTTISPAQIKQYEPVMAGGEIVLVIADMDIVMASSATLNLQVATLIA